MIAVVELELTDYRVPVMRRLQELLGEDVIVYHGAPAPGSNLNVVAPGQDIGMAHVALRQRWLFGGRLVVNDPRPLLQGARPRAVIVRHTIRNPVFPFMLAGFRRRGVPVVGWGHGYSQRRSFEPGRRITDRAHLAVVQGCDAYVTYSEHNRDVLAAHLPPERLFVAPNTVDTEPLFELRREFSRQGRRSLREEIGLDPDRPYACFIGRLHARKRPEVLLEACAVLRISGRPPPGVVFVGDGPVRGELERRAAELALSDVVFAGARYGAAAARYLYASDVMAMPGALGLAASHALALGVPVVTQRLGPDLVGHGPEAAYVRDGVNGRFVEYGDAATFAAGLADALDRREELSGHAIEFAERNLRLDDMVGGFVRAIEAVAG